MSENKKRLLLSSIPSLTENTSVDAFVKVISRDRDSFDKVVEILVYFKIMEYFKHSESREISLHENIYDYLGKTNDKIASIISYTDLLIPKMSMPRSILFTQILILVIWTGIVLTTLRSFPEILIVGKELILPSAIIFIFAPLVVLYFLFPKWHTTKKYDKISTFEEYNVVLRNLNWIQYKSDDYKRLRNEIAETLNP